MNDFDRKRRVRLMAEAIRNTSLANTIANYGELVDEEGAYDKNGKPEPFLVRYRRAISERCEASAAVSYVIGEPVEADELKKYIQRWLEPDVNLTDQ